MTRPVSGVTTFDDLTAGTDYAVGTYYSYRYAASVDNWVVGAQSSGSADSITIKGGQPDGSYGANVSIVATDQQDPLQSILLLTGDSTDFRLWGLDVWVRANQPTVQVRLIGLRDNAAVSGAQLDEAVDTVGAAGGYAHFDLGAIAAFADVDGFVVTFADPSAQLATDIAVDNVNVTFGPVLSTSAGSSAFVAAAHGPSDSVRIDPGLVLQDPDRPTLSSATVSLGGGFDPAQDVLAFQNDGSTEGDIAASYDPATGVLVLTSASGASLAQFQAALRAVTYGNAATRPTGASRTATFVAADGTDTSTAVTRTITLTTTYQPPSLTSGTPAVAIAGTRAQPVAIDPGLVVTAPTYFGFTSATVVVAAGGAPGEDVLGFSNDGSDEGDISATFDPASGTLTLVASAQTTLAQWQAALRSVTFTDLSDTPVTSLRSVSFTVADGTSTSAPVTDTVIVNAPPPAVVAVAPTIPAPAAPAAPATPDASAQTAPTETIFRFFDRTTGQHVLVTDAGERAALLDPQSPHYRPSLIVETSGFGAYAADAADPDIVSVYRFFDLKTGDHFFTTSVTERDSISDPNGSNYQPDFVLEPQALSYEHATARAGDVAVYRLFDPINGSHYYTSDRAEAAGLASAASGRALPMVAEGIAFYAPANAAL